MFCEYAERDLTSDVLGFLGSTLRDVALLYAATNLFLMRARHIHCSTDTIQPNKHKEYNGFKYVARTDKITTLFE